MARHQGDYDRRYDAAVANNEKRGRVPKVPVKHSSGAKAGKHAGSYNVDVDRDMADAEVTGHRNTYAEGKRGEIRHRSPENAITASGSRLEHFRLGAGDTYRNGAIRTASGNTVIKPGMRNLQRPGKHARED